MGDRSTSSLRPSFILKTSCVPSIRSTVPWTCVQVRVAAGPVWAVAGRTKTARTRATRGTGMAERRMAASCLFNIRRRKRGASERPTSRADVAEPRGRESPAARFVCTLRAAGQIVCLDVATAQGHWDGCDVKDGRLGGVGHFDLEGVAASGFSIVLHRDAEMRRAGAAVAVAFDLARATAHEVRNRRALHAEVGVMVLVDQRSEEHTSELQSLAYLVCRLLLEKKKKNYKTIINI